MRETGTDILVVGGGLGGVAAALAACRLGRRVVLTESTDWIGGQLTSQAVPPDENPWIDRERTGCTAAYRQLREGIRDVYRRHYPIDGADDPWLNPGRGNVSPLCHEPRIALSVLEAMLLPYRTAGLLTVLFRHTPIAAEPDGDVVRAVTLLDITTGERLEVQARYVLDATELGDVLALAGIEHVIGAESQLQTGELHALAGDADPLEQQAVSWCLVLDYLPGEDHTIERPGAYDFWRDYQAPFWPSRQLSWTTSDPVSLEPVTRPLFTGPTDDPQGDDLWHFRRILYRARFPRGFHRSDVVVVNWPQIDYWLGPLVGVTDAEQAAHLAGARELTRSMLYWMQTEAPRLDGGSGYRGLRPRGDVVGTADGLAKQIYVRESRRIRAEFTILEQHVGVEARGSLKGAEVFADSVGIGSYRIDLHPSYRRNYIDVNNWPFQIPLGALIPVRVENVLPACKNLGTTHITNGCYRLHPVEWNIGEAAGALAAHCLNTGQAPRQVYRSAERLADFQRLLVDRLGFVLAWPESVRFIDRAKRDPLGM